MLSGRGKKLAAREEGGSWKHKLIVPEAKCGLTTTEDEGIEVMLEGLVGVGPQWVRPKNRTEAPQGHSRMWENFLAEMEVFVDGEGQRLLGPNYCFLYKYKASKEDILRHRLKVGINGLLVVDADGKGHHHDD